MYGLHYFINRFVFAIAMITIVPFLVFSLLDAPTSLMNTSPAVDPRRPWGPQGVCLGPPLAPMPWDSALGDQPLIIMVKTGEIFLSTCILRELKYEIIKPITPVQKFVTQWTAWKPPRLQFPMRSNKSVGLGKVISFFEDLWNRFSIDMRLLWTNFVSMQCAVSTTTSEWNMVIVSKICMCYWV